MPSSSVGLLPQRGAHAVVDQRVGHGARQQAGGVDQVGPDLEAARCPRAPSACRSQRLTPSMPSRRCGGDASGRDRIAHVGILGCELPRASGRGGARALGRVRLDAWGARWVRADRSRWVHGPDLERRERAHRRSGRTRPLSWRRFATGGAVVGVRLHPGAAPPLFGVAAPALLDARVPAETLWGDAAKRVEEQVAKAETATERAEFLTAFLSSRALCAAEPDPLVREAAARGWRPAASPKWRSELAVSERHLRRLVERPGRLRPQAARPHAAAAPCTRAAYARAPSSPRSPTPPATPTRPTSATTAARWPACRLAVFFKTASPESATIPA